MVDQTHSLRYRPELDGLRAVAVLAVVVFHALQPSRFAGFVGVDVFFALSGYLITTILMQEFDRSRSIHLARFYRRRLLRLYPALIALVVGSFGIYRALGETFSQHIKYALIASTYTSNIYMTFRHRWIVEFTHTWSLSLEEQYYLVWPLSLLILLRTLRLDRRWLSVALLGLAAVTALFSIREFSYDSISFPIESTSTGLLAGSALALALPAPTVTRVFRLPGVAVAACVLLAGLFVSFSAAPALAAGLYPPAAVLATVLIIGYTTATGGIDSLSKILGWSGCASIGRISYGIYLWHYPVALLLTRKTHLPVGLRAVVLIVVSVGVAAVSYRYIERPFLKLKNRPTRVGVQGKGPETSDLIKAAQVKRHQVQSEDG